MVLLPLAALSANEMLLIVVVFVVLFGGATQIPKLARALGRAKGEYQTARRDFEAEMQQASSDGAPPRSAASAVASSPAGTVPMPSGSDANEVRRAAREMGIDTEGRSDDELKEEMRRRLG